MNHDSCGPIFGSGHDIFISNECDKIQSWCNIGKSYACVHPFGSQKANNLLAGKSNFLVKDYEVWAIIS